MDIMAKNFLKCYNNLIYIKRNTMHKRESIRIPKRCAPLFT